MKFPGFARTTFTILALTSAFVLMACGQPQTSQQASDEPATTPSAQQPGETPAPAEAEPAESPSAETGRAQERAQAAQPPAYRPPHATRREGSARPADGEAQRVAESVPYERPAPPDVAPAPQPIVKTVPAGTTVDVVFLDALSSETANPGDSFRARVTHDVVQDGIVVIPAGSTVAGSVTEAVPLKKIGGTAKLALEFSKLELPSGGTADIDASLVEQGKSETKKDAATIGGATAGGALLGKIIGKKGKSALIGAAVGAAAGTAIAAKTHGEQVEIPVGTEMTLHLDRPTHVTVRQ